MKKYHLLISFFILFFLFPLSTNYVLKENNVSNRLMKEALSSTEYYDWGDVTTLDPNYSYSTIFYTKDTKFIIHRCDVGKVTFNKTKSGISIPKSPTLTKGKVLIMQITNCAVNKDGELLDVVVKVFNVSPFSSGGNIDIEVPNILNLLKSQDKVSATTIDRPVDVGDPIVFRLNAHNASCSFSLTYYKAGTYVYDNDGGSGELGNIESVNGLFTDVDVPASSKNSKVYFSGNEGIFPTTGSSIMYYNKNKYEVSASNFKKTFMREDLNGLSIDQRKDNTNGVWFATSTLLLTKNISNSYYEFTYSGVGCGIWYFFASPYPYEIDSPYKSSNLKEVVTNESFEYTISQYIPNNYYGNLFNFSEIYSNLFSNTRLTSLSLNDQIDENLIIGSDIKVLNESLLDVSDYFYIDVIDNYVKATVKDEYFDDLQFYNHTYNLVIPVSIKKGISNVDFISNKGYVTSNIGDSLEEEMPTPEIDVRIKYRLTVNYYDEMTGEKIDSSDEYVYYCGDSYTTSYDKIDDDWIYTGNSGNISGTIYQDTEVNYYFSFFRRLPVTGGEGLKKILYIGLSLLLFSALIVLIIIKKSFIK